MFLVELTLPGDSADVSAILCKDLDSLQVPPACGCVERAPEVEVW